MRFLFVDRIDELLPAQIKGRRRFGLADPWRYAHHPIDGALVAQGVVSEAIGQLASWLCLARNDFTARPVFLFADAIELTRSIPAGSEVELHASVEAMSAETFTFSGDARLDGRVVQRIERCSGYFMPLADLEDPFETRRRFGALTTGGLTLVGSEAAPFDFAALVEDVLELVPGEKIRVAKTFSTAEPYFADHFPRFPVAPIVVLNEMIAAAAKRAFGGRMTAVRDIKIKSFVRPGDTCEARVTAERRDGPTLHTIAEILKDGRRILRGAYEFEVQDR